MSAKDHYEKILLPVSDSKLPKENSCQTGKKQMQEIQEQGQTLQHLYPIPGDKAGSSRGEQMDGKPHSAIGRGKTILSSGWYILEHVSMTLVLRDLHFHGKIYQMQAKIKEGRESFSQTYA